MCYCNSCRSPTPYRPGLSVPTCRLLGPCSEKSTVTVGSVLHYQQPGEDDVTLISDFLGRAGKRRTLVASSLGRIGRSTQKRSHSC